MSSLKGLDSESILKEFSPYGGLFSSWLHWWSFLNLLWLWLLPLITCLSIAIAAEAHGYHSTQSHSCCSWYNYHQSLQRIIVILSQKLPWFYVEEHWQINNGENTSVNQKSTHFTTPLKKSTDVLDTITLTTPLLIIAQKTTHILYSVRTHTLTHFEIMPGADAEFEDQ